MFATTSRCFRRRCSRRRYQVPRSAASFTSSRRCLGWGTHSDRLDRTRSRAQQAKQKATNRGGLRPPAPRFWTTAEFAFAERTCWKLGRCTALGEWQPPEFLTPKTGLRSPQLTHLYLPGMVERRSGAILIVSSTAAYQGVPYMATYAASKAFGLLFAEALAREVERYGVRVCALCPGPSTSEFGKVAGVPDEIVVNVEPADHVARVGLRALAAGEHSVVSGFTNWVGVEVQRLAPRRFVMSAAEMLFRPRH